MAPEEILLSIMEGVQVIDFAFIGQLILLMLAVLWGFTILWVWSDSGERSTSVIFRMVMVLFIAPFNIPGLLIYLMIRPSQTIEEVYWAELERKYLIYETSELEDCTKCDYQLMPGYNNCPHCGTDVKVQCTGCNVMIDRDFKYCPFCSTQMRKRAASGEPELTTQEMEESIEEQRAEVIETVEKRGTKYARRGGVMEAIRGAFRQIRKDFKTIGKAVRKSTKNVVSSVKDGGSKVVKTGKGVVADVRKSIVDKKAGEKMNIKKVKSKKKKSRKKKSRKKKGR